MAHKIIVRTDTGTPGSLRHQTKIVFAFGPRQTSVPYDPVGWDTRTFLANSAQLEHILWGPNFAFCRYYTVSEAGRTHCNSAGNAGEISSGQSCTVGKTECSPGGSFMGGPSFGESTTMIVNAAGSTRNVALQMNCSSTVFYSCAALHPVKNGERCFVSLDLIFQAYIVDGEGSYDDHVLTPEHRTKPLFSTPVSCDSLPDVSTWRLSQDESGTMRLVNDQNPTLSSASSEAPTTLLSDIQSQLTTVLDTLGTVTERLVAVEKSVANNQAEISAVQRSLLDSRSLLDHLDGVGAAAVPSVKLEASLVRIDERVTLVEKSVSRACTDITAGHGELLEAVHQLSEMGKKVGKATADVVALDRRIPGIEEKVEKLTGSLGTTQEDVIAVQKSCLVMHNRLSDVDSSLAVHRKLLNDLTEKGSTGLASEVAAGGDRSSPAAQVGAVPRGTTGDPSELQGSVRTLEQQVAALDRRSSTVELRGDKLARGFGQALESLTSVNKFLQTNRQQIAGLESKVPILEVKTRVLSESFAATGEQISGLESRVLTVEEKVEFLSASIAGIRERGGGGPPSVKGSPVMFPSRGLEAPFAAAGSLVSGAHPLFVLPQPLDEDLFELSGSTKV